MHVCELTDEKSLMCFTILSGSSCNRAPFFRQDIVIGTSPDETMHVYWNLIPSVRCLGNISGASTGGPDGRVVN